MKAIRRSLKGEKEPKHHHQHHHHISITPKSALAILPPKKVIKALYDYTPDPNSQELAFSKGDFFHVISREDDSDWYEACNPLIPDARGLVPVSFFEVIGKNERDSGGSSDLQKNDHHDSGFSDRTPVPDSSPTKFAPFRMSALGKGQGAMVYGIVQYDFQAERPDELDARAGEAIIVIAQSNPEWFVAKPIGRLGGPGLIPVSFIELRDMQSGQAVTDPLEAVRRAGVPKVEEWKKMTAEYKNSSITLGKIEAGGGGGGGGGGVVAVTTGMDQMSMGQPGHMSQNGDPYGNHQRNASKGTLASQGPMSMSQGPQQPYQPPLLAPVAASIPRYCFDNDKYWYIIEAKMEDGRCWELSRYYHDFYDFQIALLTQFEDEAGNRGRPRTLPFMPGPVTHVTDAISNGRRQNLDEYIKKLLSMPPHIARCQLVRQLFGPRQGDFEIDPSAFGEEARYSGDSHHSSSGVDPSQSVSRQSSQVPMNSSQDRVSQQRAPGPASLSNGGPPAMNRQPSSLTQASATSNSSAMKVKVFFQDDLIAIRIPSGVTLQHLKDKLSDRLKIQEDIIVQYRDESSGTYVDLISDADLENAMQRNTKLTLFVSIA